MRLELWFILITGTIVYNVFYDNSLTKLYSKYKKHAHIAGIVLGMYFLYASIKRDPGGGGIQTAMKFAKYTPFAGVASSLEPMVDFATGSRESVFQPILDFTQGGSIGAKDRELTLRPTLTDTQLRREGIRTKRSVSNHKKKYVAARQDWICAGCSKRLDHLYEIDHKIRLADGGSNEVDNLVALCPHCHRQKTADERIRDL